MSTSSSESGNESTDLDTGSDSDTGSINDNSNSDNEEFVGNNETSRGKALQLISLERSTDFEETLQLKLNHNVLQSVLATCGDKPLCVIVITGHARSGKSFMLNCIKEGLKAAENEERGNWLGNTKSISGFEWKHGYKRNTEGIWIWSRAFHVMDEEDKEVAVLLLDTQGFSDEGISTAEEVSAILGISLLISSILIINVTGDIAEECLDWLSPFTKYASLCVSKGLRDPFQKLSFLVRDWSMLLEHQFGGDSGKKYLEKVLSANSSQGKRLKNGWEELECFLMPNIGSSGVLNAFTGNPADLNKDFCSRLKGYVNLVTSEKSLEHTKKIFGNEIGADELKGFLESYVELWNNKTEVEMGLRPESILKVTFEAAGKIKVERGLEAYREMYKQRKWAAGGDYLKNASIDSVHIQGRIKALDSFKQFVLPVEENKQFQRKLEELLDQECKQLKKENEGARTTKISDNVSKACNKLRKGLQEKFPFTPEVGVNIPDSLVFYEENVLEEVLEEMRESIELEFLEEFEGEDEEGRVGLRRMINSVLQPITEEYTVKNLENRGRAMSSAKQVKDRFREEYLREMQDDLDSIPNMEANVLGVFHAKAVKAIEIRFRELSLGTPVYQAKWLEELKDEISREHEILELSLESTMAKALKMASEETEKYKRQLEEHAQACEEEEEMLAFHQATSQAILKKFTLDNPFARDPSKGEVIYRKLENLLRAAFTQVVEDGVMKRRRMEDDLLNAGLTTFQRYKEDMEGTLSEMEFLDGEHFEMKEASSREKALNYYEEEIDGITLEVEKLEEAKNELVYKLDEKARYLRNENEQRRSMAIGQAEVEIVSALEKYESKMMIAASQLSSREELRGEHEKWREAVVQQFHEKCQSKNEGLRVTYIEKLMEGVEVGFSGVEEFFSMAKQKENVDFMTALLTCQTEYVAHMNQEFGNKNGYFAEKDLKKLHEKGMKTALGKLSADSKLSNKQKKDLEEKLGKVFERYKERNDLVFRSFQNNEPAIGIDLGTTYCCVAIYMKGKVQIVRNSVSGDIIPSYVRFNPDGTKIFGTPAKDEAYLSPETTIFDAKRIIGRRMDDEHLQKDMKMWPFTVVEDGGGPKIEVNGKKYFPEEISSFLLEHLKKEAEATLGCEIKKAVITVPAYFTDGQRDATVKAGELAGLEVLGILNEPTAAAVAYRLDCCYDDKERNILVYDLGGGTFDVAVLKLGKDKIDVLAFDGDGHLGGEDFDEKMMTYCAKKFLENTGFDLFENKDSAVKTVRDDVRRKLRRLKTVCEEKKKALATAPAATVSIAAFEDGEDLIVEVTKKGFEEMNESLFLKTISIVDRALVSADLRKEEIDEIVLVGGSTKIPRLQRMLSDHFNGKALNKKINPDQAVAYGAAVQAAIKCAKPEEKIFDFGVIQEVTPMSLGIETATKEFDIIIPKGTKIPTTKKQEYATHRDNQDSAWIRIFQGENMRRAVDNKLLGDFTLEGIPPNGMGKEVVVVSMHIDANGILSVEATCQSNKGSKKMTVSEENKGIMTNEIKKRLIQERQKS